MNRNNDNLGLVVLSNCKSLGEKINDNLIKLRSKENGYIIPCQEIRFSNGEGKVHIESSVRGKEIYIIADVGNYGMTYKFHGKDSLLTPDEHFTDIKRAISATCGHANNIIIVMPLLYESRQHKRKSRESLDCAIALQELENMGVSNIITFDAHDPNVSNAIPRLSFDNFYPTNTILEQMVEDDPDFFSNCLVISPDFGAMERARYYAEIIGCDVGAFYKRRDLTKTVNGKSPIVEHKYIGTEVAGKNVLIVDDMIASGGSMVEVAEELKIYGANKVYLTATFSLFTEGVEAFDKAYEDKLFDMLYTTNVSYIPEEISNKKWIKEVDLSLLLAKIIDKLNTKESLKEFFDGKTEIVEKIKKGTNNI